jgi:DNA-binding protein H-NS
MKKFKLDGMSVDELWVLHEEVSRTLAARLSAERRVLVERLNLLSNQRLEPLKPRPYPPVLPKFQNPDNPNEKWSGRGRRPHWVTHQLGLGKRIEDLKI